MKTILSLLFFTVFLFCPAAFAGVEIKDLDDRIRIEVDGKLFTEWRHKEWLAPYFLSGHRTWWGKTSHATTR